MTAGGPPGEPVLYTHAGDATGETLYVTSRATYKSTDVTVIYEYDCLNGGKLARTYVVPRGSSGQ